MKTTSSRYAGTTLPVAIKKWLEESYPSLIDEDINALVEFCENKLFKIQDNIKEFKKKYGEYPPALSIPKRFAEIKNINTNKVEKWQTTLGDELGRIKNLFYGDEKRKAGFEKPELFFVWYLMQKKECAYCGISETECREAVENLSKKFKSERIRGLHLEVDRQNPKGPYSDKNCVLSCYFCNNDKSDRFDSEEYKKFLYAREEYLRSIIRKDK